MRARAAWRAEDVAVHAFRAILVGLAAYSAVVTPRYTTRPLLVASALSGLAASLLFEIVPSTRPRVLRASEAASLAAVTMHVSGHAFGFYAAFPWYDKALHFLIPLAVVLVLHGLSQATTWIWDWSRVTKLEAGIFLFSMAVTFGTLWEVFEFGTDQLLGTEEQNGLHDTMWDLVMDAAGALVGVALASRALDHARAEDAKRRAQGASARAAAPADAAR